MLFPTIDFAVFFFILFPLYWLVRRKKRLRIALLITASYFFYGYWDIRFTLLLFLSSLINWVTGLLVGQDNKRARFYLIIGLCLNLGILFFFKYTDFVIRSINNFILNRGGNYSINPIGLILPVGISFFTFQGISYIVDVYRGVTPYKRNFAHIILYISFFPQLVAGPILRSNVFLPQLENTPHPDSINIGFAMRKIFGGLFKKIVIANYLAVLIVDPAFSDPGIWGSWELLWGAYAYGIQIFCDFSAYSDIAIGIANLLGFSFTENFNKPYSASSLKEFWRKWHISLSTWLRDYLYIPLGGSRKGSVRTMINIFLTMLLGGIWHGAGWNFILWGIIHGTWLILERFFVSDKKEKSFFRKFFGTFITFQIVSAAWIFFRAENFDMAREYFLTMAGKHASAGTLVTPFVIILILSGFSIHFIPSSWENKIEAGLNRLPLVLIAVLCTFLFLLLQITAPEGMAPFIYFQF
jgi:alginate O-acetyltransferase complex protein AlgI